MVITKMRIKDIIRMPFIWMINVVSIFAMWIILLYVSFCEWFFDDVEIKDE